MGLCYLASSLSKPRGLCPVGNTSPTNTVPGAQSAEFETPLTLGTISIADTEGGTMTVTLAVTQGTLTLGGTTGLTFSVGDGTADATMTFTGTVAAINTALTGTTYTGNNGYLGADTLTLTTTDSGGLSDQDTVAITVGDFNILGLAPAAWYKNNTGLYQDSAGTTPVTANDDPIGLWQDQSGNGKHLQQTTAASRPLHKTNQQNSLPAVDFAGVVHCFASASTITITSKFDNFIVFKDRDTANIIYEHSADFNANDGMGFVGDNDGGIQVRRGGLTSLRNGLGIGSVWRVGCHSWNGDHTTNHGMYISDDATLTIGSSVTANTPADTSETDTLYVGRRNQLLFAWNGQIAEMIFCPKLSATNIGKVMRFLGAKFGITIT